MNVKGELLNAAEGAAMALGLVNSPAQSPALERLLGALSRVGKGHRRWLVILESPFAGDVDRNVEYARACVAHSLSQGEAPIASHLLYTQPGVLDDTDPEQRAAGIAAGLAWREVADYAVVYTDLGISNGMRLGIEAHREAGLDVEYRSLPGGWPRG